MSVTPQGENRMPRRPVIIPAETVDAMLAGVAAGSSLAEMCRRYQLARGTVGDHLARDPVLAARLNEAKAAGRLARAARPRQRHARAAGEAVHADRAPAVSQPSPAPSPPAGASLQADPPRRRHAAAPGAAVQPAPTAPAAAQKPVVHFAVSLDLGEMAEQFNRLLHLVADATARGAPRP